jgi:hypothetical protein
MGIASLTYPRGSGFVQIGFSRGTVEPDRLENKRSPDEPTGRANARPMTGSATSGVFALSIPHIAALMRATC